MPTEECVYKKLEIVEECDSKSDDTVKGSC